jgi:hypothetical protein
VDLDLMEMTEEAEDEEAITEERGRAGAVANS